MFMMFCRYLFFKIIHNYLFIIITLIIIKLWIRYTKIDIYMVGSNNLYSKSVKIKKKYLKIKTLFCVICTI